MSFFTLVPNYISNATRMPNTVQMQPHYALSQRLMMLSTALRTSILCYQKHLTEACFAQETQNQHIKKPMATSITKEKLESKLKETEKLSHFCNKKQIDSPQQKTNSSNIITPRQSPAISPKIDVQCNPTHIQGVIAVKKSQTTKHSKQVSRKPLKDREEVMLPEVDLNDGAYLPEIGLAQSALIKMRQELLKRSVVEWKELDQGRRDRRQLRMLNN